MTINDNRKFGAFFYLSEDAVLKSADVVEGTIASLVNDNEVEFTGIFQGKSQTIVLPIKNLFNTREEAQKKIEAGLAWKERNILEKAVGGNVGFLPPSISQNSQVRISGNPLRCGEPMIGFGAQSNTWGEKDNPQKILQMAGAVWEDIETLKCVLYVLGFANNYTKKLIGKYIVIELNSLFMCFQKLAEMDDHYKITLFSDLLAEIKTLENKYEFRAIRDKVAAHRDTNLDMIAATGFWKRITRYTVNRYISTFTDHLSKLLMMYPNEGKLYFGLRNHPLNGIVGTADTDDYDTFDEPFIVKESAQRGIGVDPEE